VLLATAFKYWAMRKWVVPQADARSTAANASRLRVVTDEEQREVA
jgi:hypothetical protein